MTLLRLEIIGLRNIADAQLDLHAKLNVFVGSNGSGKTSLLESLYLLSSGRSFRSSKVKSIVKDGSDKLVVFGKVERNGTVHSLGLQKDRNNHTQIRIDSQGVKASSELARLVPLQVLGPDICELVTEGPSVRRRFLDWGLFHVEQSFYPNWIRFQKALDQRNALLKEGVRNDSYYLPWENELLATSGVIDALRISHVEKVVGKAFELIQQAPLLSDYLADLAFEYDPGFNREVGLENGFISERSRDFLSPVTGSGPHRADLKISIARNNAKEILSRGQAKILSHSLRIAQVKVLNETLEQRICLLVDDLGAELDRNSQLALLKMLDQCNTQLFITTLENDFITQYSTESKLFHVEHGRITEKNKVTMECQ